MREPVRDSEPFRVGVSIRTRRPVPRAARRSVTKVAGAGEAVRLGADGGRGVGAARGRGGLLRLRGAWPLGWDATSMT
jgi:hypothetical protein